MNHEVGILMKGIYFVAIIAILSVGTVMVLALWQPALVLAAFVMLVFTSLACVFFTVDWLWHHHVSPLNMDYQFYGLMALMSVVVAVIAALLKFDYYETIFFVAILEAAYNGIAFLHYRRKL